MFSDPRLTAFYDLINPHDEDTPFYVQLADELRPVDVIDLGCGTGRLALILAGRGYRVAGVDPSKAMLDVARAKTAAETVSWIEGGVEKLVTESADLVFMTGHVAQFFLTENAWREGLVNIRRALRVSGVLAFETRNPTSRPWEVWSREHSYRVTRTPIGDLETWYEVASVRDRVVTYSLNYRFPTGEVARDDNQVIFRTDDEVAVSLAKAGFVIERTYGDWDRSPVSPDSPELIYVASRSSSDGRGLRKHRIAGSYRELRPADLDDARRLVAPEVSVFAR